MATNEPESRCQHPGVEQASAPTVDYPWRGDPREYAKNKLTRYAVNNSEGVRPIVAANAVLDGTDADQRLAYRFYQKNPAFFRSVKRGEEVWVYPYKPAYSLTHQDNHALRTHEGSGVASQSGGETVRREGGGSARGAGDGSKARGESETGSGSGSGGGSDRSGTPRMDATAHVGSRSALNKEWERGKLLQKLGAKVSGVEGRYKVLRAEQDGDEWFRCIKAGTRFSDPGKAKRNRRQYESVWREAGRRFDHAVAVTLSTHADRFQSVYDCVEGESRDGQSRFMDDVQRFISWLKYQLGEGTSKASIRTLKQFEFTDDGIIHCHILVFGHRWLVTKEHLQHYWSQRQDRAHQVWFTSLEHDGQHWRFKHGDRPEDAQQGRTPREYYGKMVDALVDMAHADSEEIIRAAKALRNGETETETDAYARGKQWWKLGLYWLFEYRFWTASPCLKVYNRRERGSDGWADGPSYEFVTIAEYGQLSGYIRDRAIVAQSTPPPGG